MQTARTAAAKSPTHHYGGGVRGSVSATHGALQPVESLAAFCSRGRRLVDRLKRDH